MSVEGRIEELRARLLLAGDAATLLLVVVPSDVSMGEVRVLLLDALRATPLRVEDLGRCNSRAGPASWAESTKQQPGVPHVLAFVPSAPLETRAFAHLLNAERGLLRGLAGPVVVLVSRQTERVLRERAHDFFTWVAHSYELPGPKVLRMAIGKLGAAQATTSVEDEPEEEPIRFLHVSDFHLRVDRVKAYDQDRVLRGLVEFLERDRKVFPLDLVFVTGDLAHSGQPEQYALVVEFFERLLAVTKLEPSRLFVVPGNHDVDRRVGRWLLRTLGDDARAIEFFEEPDGRKLHLHKLTAYARAMRGLLGDERSLGLEVGAEAVEMVEIRGTRLAVASFSSAWFAQDDGDLGKLWVGEPNVERAIDRIADEKAAFAVALLHHPFEYLHELERDLVERWFERGIDLVLRGHLHTNRSRSIASQRGGYVEVAAPSAYQGSQWGNGCLLGEIRARARAVRLRPLAYASGPDPWVLDTKVFPNEAADGYCGTFAVPEKWRERSGVAAPKRAALEAAYRKAPARAQQLAEEAVRGMRGATSPRPEQDTLFELDASSSLRQEVLGSDLGVALVEAIEQQEQPRVEITDLEGFEQLLVRAGRLLMSGWQQLGVPWERLTERHAVHGLAAALGMIVDAPIDLEPRLEGGLRPDIVIGRVGAQDVVELVRSRRSRDFVTEALPRLERALAGISGRFGGLAVLRGTDAPSTQTTTTSSGKPVVVLTL